MGKEEKLRIPLDMKLENAQQQILTTRSMKECYGTKNSVTIASSALITPTANYLSMD
jgi:hypothetical protein